MIKAAEKTFVRSIRQKREQIATLREELDDLNDYLDMTEARARRGQIPSYPR
jgi:outer membrane protein TolC